MTEEQSALGARSSGESREDRVANHWALKEPESNQRDPEGSKRTNERAS